MSGVGWVEEGGCGEQMRVMTVEFGSDDVGGVDEHGVCRCE